MSGLQAFFEMGGYALYVWGAYGVTFAVVLGLGLASWRGLKAREQALARLEAARPRRRGRP